MGDAENEGSAAAEARMWEVALEAVDNCVQQAVWM